MGKETYMYEHPRAGKVLAILYAPVNLILDVRLWDLDSHKLFWPTNKHENKNHTTNT